MEFEINKNYDLKIIVGVGKTKKILKQKVIFLGKVDESERKEYLLFLRTKRKRNQPKTLAISPRLIHSAN